MGLAWPGGVGTTKAVGAPLDMQDPGLVTFPPALWPWSLWAGRGGSVHAGAKALPVCGSLFLKSSFVTQLVSVTSVPYLASDEV